MTHDPSRFEDARWTSYMRFEDERWRAHAREHQLEKEARDRAFAVNDTRLEGMNELREQITGERGNYATREMLELMEQRLTHRIEEMTRTIEAQLEANKSTQDVRLKMLENKVSNYDGRIAMLAIVFTVITTVLFLASRFL